MKSTPHVHGSRSLRVFSICVVLMGALTASACYSVKVRTLGAPQANLAQFRTFQILDTPIKLDQQPLTAWANEPMLNNAITYQAGRAYLKQALEARGFVEDNKNPDFKVAFYASARERININNFGYGYGYGYGYGANTYVTEYTEGTVLVDLVDPDKNQLVWRGSGVATVSDNPNKYLKELGRIVPKIVDRIPAITPTTVVQR